MRWLSSLPPKELGQPSVQYKVSNSWEKAQIILLFIAPLAVGGGTIWFNLQIEERATGRAVEDAGLARMAAIINLVPALSSEDPDVRLVAISVLNDFMPGGAPSVLNAVASIGDGSGDGGGGPTAAIASIVEARPTTLARQLFAAAQSDRLIALQSLLGNSAPDPELVIPFLLGYATENIGSVDGVANALRYLRGLPDRTVQANRSLIEPFLDLASGNGPTSTRLAGDVREKLN